MIKARYLVSQILPPFIKTLVQYIYRYTSKDTESLIRSELLRLWKYKPKFKGRTLIFGQSFEFVDARSFVGQYNLFFIKKRYNFTARTECPKIIDCGANVGVSVLWWKHIYPRAEIIAFEADPTIFETLKSNCAHLEGVTLHNAAVSIRDDEMLFASTGGEGGRLIESGDAKDHENVCKVRSIRLRDYIVEGCDFLKVDIEGAESEVISDCSDVLHSTHLMFVEFHSFFHKKQSLGAFFSHIENAGFRVHAHVDLPSPSPFCELFNFNRKDLRLNLFCFKDGEYPAIKMLG